MKSKFDWENFLKQWSEEVFSILSPVQKQNPSSLWELEKEFFHHQTLLKPPATALQIETLENRLNTTLPQSYLDFLAVSNGWLQLGMDVDDGLLWSTEDVKWFREQDPQWLEAWCYDNEVCDRIYFVYGEKQDCVHIRTEYLPSTLAISNSIESAVYLLNPEIITEEGEWEAWYFCNALPGANRYPSFLEMMIGEKERIMNNLRESVNFRLHPS